MDLLDFMVEDELLPVFRCKKTELSCMDNPQIFLNQLRDHSFVPEEKYKTVSRMKSKERIRRGIYEILDWVEKNRSKDIQLFWKCVFKDVMLNQYPTLKLLHRSFLDGTIRASTQSAQKVDKEAEATSEGNQLSENEKKKKKKRSKSVCEDGQEQPGPSSQVTPTKKIKSTKIIYSSPLKRGEKGEIWTWPLYKVQLPVTCGDQEGILRREKLAEGGKCIFANKQWFTPNEFEKFAGREKSKNWKLSIRCEGTPLGQLIKEGHLKSAHVKRGPRGSKKSLSSPQMITDSEEDEDEENCSEDEESQSSPDLEEDEDEEDEEPQSTSDKEKDADRNNGGTQKVFNVTCGSLTGKLYKERFATGYCGKSIRTETSWMTPKDFAKEGSGQTECLWRRDIQWEGKPLSDLIEQELLRIHSVQCGCKRCSPEENDLLHQENDDECWVCKRETDEDLVMCDFCPRSFHQKCHLPHVEDGQLRDDREWMCTFCMFRSSQDHDDFDTVEKNRVMFYQMSQYTLECYYLVLSLCSADEKRIFATDPSLHLENYSSLIKNPMWLSKVADKLQKREYETVGQFVSDVQLIFTNCAAYHESDADARAVGEKSQKLFEREFTTAFNVHDDSTKR